MVGGRKEEGETLARTNKVFIFWGELEDPSFEKISSRIGLVVQKEDIFCFPVYIQANEDPVKYYTDYLDQKIQRWGIPRAVIASRVKQLSYFSNNIEMPARTRHEVTQALGKKVEEYGCVFFDIPEEDLRSPDAFF